MARKSQSTLRILADLTLRAVVMTVVVAAALLAVYFPRSVDQPLSAEDREKAIAYYAKAYAKPGAESGEDPVYVEVAQMAAKEFRIEEKVAEFVRGHGLADKKVLDVGAGRGYLQNIVADYTGLDISTSARRYFTKPFVLGSATAMPFADGAFDAAWSVWVLEHVPNPEAALVEMRRVVRDGGLLYLYPAWNCTPWLADGYAARPYAHFGVGGKLIKALLPVELYFRALGTLPVRAVRYANWRAAGTPTRLRYQRLQPNFEKYWQPDSDAVNGLDRSETALWFLSRGDECLNCAGAFSGGATDPELIIRVRKPGVQHTARAALAGPAQTELR